MCMGAKEAFCPAQCGGRGECDLGFCRCHSGWYGTDCSRKAALGTNGMADAGGSAGGASLSDEGQLAEDPALQENTPSVFARVATLLRPWLPPGVAQKLDGGSSSSRRGAGASLRQRPFIYVYDLPPLYNARMLQYKNKPNACSHRLFGSKNRSVFNDVNYAIETYLHEAMLTSAHR